MFIATDYSFKYSSLREERNWFPAHSAAGCCAPTEREPNSVTQSIKMSPRWGENPT
jgi:hypothetical protein